MASLLSTFLLLSTFISFISVSSSASHYTSLCNSIVPENTPTHPLKPSAFPLSQLHTGFFTGGDRIVGSSSSWHQNSFSLQTKNMHATKSSGLFKIEASLSFRSSNPYYYAGNSSRGSHRRYPGGGGKVVIKLGGFWSGSSGRICMVGRGSGYSQDDDFLRFDAVFKLSNVVNKSDVTSLITGSLESLSSADDSEGYFEPLSVLMLPKKNYNYSLDSKDAELDFASDGSDSEEGLPLDSVSFSSNIVSRLNLEYSRDCSVDSAKNCNPINGSSLPSVISLDQIECSYHTKKPMFRVLIGFPTDGGYYYSRSNGVARPYTSLFVGEGWWDEKQNQLCVVACHFMGLTTSSSSSSSSSSLAGLHVGDCSIRLRLKFHSVLSIQDTSTIVGEIWSNKTVKDSGYFRKIKVANYEDFGYSKVMFQGLKYEYTQLERAKNSCPTRQNHDKNQEKRYPDANSYYMRSDMSVRDSKKRIAWASLTPLTVDDDFYNMNQYQSSFDSELEYSTFFNVSYEITMSNYYGLMSVDNNSLFNKSSERVRISAEGTYDAETGNVCMVGCRNIVSNTSWSPKAESSKDCEILIKFEFPPLDAKRGSYLKGSIESTRKVSDPLYFRALNLSGNAFYTQRGNSAWRMDMEFIMVLVSATLACVFVVSQLFHVKRHPNVLPSISLVMLSVLTLGYMVPLVLNFEALFTQDPNNRNFVVLRGAGWFRVEVNETTVRLLTMVVFLLQFRLLHVTWSARKTDEKSHKTLWTAEKKAVCVTLPLYALGFLIALLLKTKNNNEALSFHQPSYWGSLKHYGGLVLDGFLLPQIMFNLFSNRKENALSCLFYFGTSFVRVLPHAYDLYRAHTYDDKYYDSYYYADPSEDFFSTAWDIVIPLGSLVFAVIIFLQQRFGGRCVLPRRFRRPEGGYEKVPMVVTEAEEEKEEHEAEAQIDNI